MSDFHNAADYILKKNEELYRRLSQPSPASNMTESHYWTALEYRLCREFRGMADKRLCSLWCDGLVAEKYELDSGSPRILGTVWICKGLDQEPWRFELLLGHPVESREQIDWMSLLPAENVTKWLWMDFEGKRIEIDPSAAICDRSAT